MTVGCLEFIFELIVEGIIDGWVYLMTLILPKNMNRKLHKVLKTVIGIECLLFLISMIIGVILMFNDDMGLVIIGKFALFVPLGISAVQISLGLLMRYVFKL